MERSAAKSAFRDRLFKFMKGEASTKNSEVVLDVAKKICNEGTSDSLPADTRVCPFCHTSRSTGNHSVRVTPKPRMTKKVSSMLARQSKTCGSRRLLTTSSGLEEHLLHRYWSTPNRLAVTCKVCEKSQKFLGESRSSKLYFERKRSNSKRPAKEATTPNRTPASALSSAGGGSQKAASRHKPNLGLRRFVSPAVANTPSSASRASPALTSTQKRKRTKKMKQGLMQAIRQNKDLMKGGSTSATSSALLPNFLKF